MSRFWAAVKTVSKIMLKYENPWTTQRCLGKVRDAEALKGFKYLCGAPKMYDLFFLGPFVLENLVKLLVSLLMDTAF
jgi:hypothetical protein